MNNEDFVSYEIAQALNRLGYDGSYEYMYATENFCYGNNPISFDTISVGERIPECVAYYVNDDNEDDYKGIPCPSLTQVQKWLRETKGLAINVVAHDGGYYMWDVTFLPNAPEYKTPIHLDFRQYNTYESALSAGIKAALKMITSNTDKI